MTPFKVLGYTDCKPAVVLVDRASPYSQVSAAFLLRNNVRNRLSPTRDSYARLTVAVPSQGGYYTSSNMRPVSSIACAVNVVLGADWLGSWQVATAVNVLQQPSSERVASLPEGHGWTADGTSELEMRMNPANDSSRSLPAVFPATLP